jgi:hypothetical protein
MGKLKEIWKSWQAHAHLHERAYRHAHHTTHVCYLGMVAFHGPYYLPAMVLLVITLVGWVLHLEGEL